MGAWGAGTFENDDALDWIAELEQSGGLSAVRTALGQAADPADEYLEAPTCNAALAAAEVVAALHGAPAPDLPEEVERWVQAQQLGVADNLLRVAREVVERVGRQGELRELWEEAEPDDFNAWQRSLADLRSRLS